MKRALSLALSERFCRCSSPLPPFISEYTCRFRPDLNGDELACHCGWPDHFFYSIMSTLMSTTSLLKSPSKSLLKPGVYSSTSVTKSVTSTGARLNTTPTPFWCGRTSPHISSSRRCMERCNFLLNFLQQLTRRPRRSLDLDPAPAAPAASVGPTYMV